MALSEQDRIDINDLLSLHGHLTDTGQLNQAGELFTADVTYDLDDFGLGSLHGTTAMRGAALALGDANPVGHHVTNVVITQIGDGSARVQSKGIGINADGTAGSVAYDDLVTRGPDGWKISYRKVTAQRTALGGQKAGAHQVLERLRQAAISQSADDMSRLYAADAVHEFPFTPPGVPSRLEGRDEIVNWIAAGWRAFPLKYERYRTLAVHDTGDPETIIVEQQALGTSESTGEFALANIVVLTVHDGQITRLRDYVNVQAAAAAMGREQQTQLPVDFGHQEGLVLGGLLAGLQNLLGGGADRHAQRRIGLLDRVGHRGGDLFRGHGFGPAAHHAEGFVQRGIGVPDGVVDALLIGDVEAQALVNGQAGQRFRAACGGDHPVARPASSTAMARPMPREAPVMSTDDMEATASFTHDELLDDIMLYWLPNSAASAARLYREMTQAGWSAPATIDSPTTLATGFTMSPKEHVRKSRRWLERRYSNVIYFSELQAGGDFAALEQPTGFVGDARATFRLLR